MSKDVLAGGIAGLHNDKKYFAKDLIHKSTLIEVFDYCQIQQAYINAKGWAFIFQEYKLKGILEVDKESMWLDDEDLGEWITSI